MASVQLTLTGATPSIFALPTATGRVVVTLIGGTPAEVWVTVDGTAPVAPSNNVINNSSQVTIGGALGSSAIIQPPLFGDHMAAPTLRFASLGTPLVQIDW